MMRDSQRRLNLNVLEVVKNEKLVGGGIIYPARDSEWMILGHVVPKKGWIIVIENTKHEQQRIGVFT